MAGFGLNDLKSRHVFLAGVALVVVAIPFFVLRNVEHATGKDQSDMETLFALAPPGSKLVKKSHDEYSRPKPTELEGAVEPLIPESPDDTATSSHLQDSNVTFPKVQEFELDVDRGDVEYKEEETYSHKKLNLGANVEYLSQGRVLRQRKAKSKASKSSGHYYYGQDYSKGKGYYWKGYSSKGYYSKGYYKGSYYKGGEASSKGKGGYYGSKGKGYYNGGYYEYYKGKGGPIHKGGSRLDNLFGGRSEPAAGPTTRHPVSIPNWGRDPPTVSPTSAPGSPTAGGVSPTAVGSPTTTVEPPVNTPSPSTNDSLNGATENPTQTGRTPTVSPTAEPVPLLFASNVSGMPCSNIIQCTRATNDTDPLTCQKNIACFDGSGEEDGVCLKEGNPRFSLFWKGSENYDLHVILPNGFEMSPQNRYDEMTGTRMTLVTDPGGEFGTYSENIVMPLGMDQPVGNYTIFAKLASEAVGNSGEQFGIYVAYENDKDPIIFGGPGVNSTTGEGKRITITLPPPKK